ncbi:MAG TPA: biopolymer transporter ExbD [Blastocatellia bacterium]|nr:biopolymer transporter ExbD [Blastocatellia bacterium]
MGMAMGGDKGYVADINVTPMVDVMLVLLIIFMVIAPMLQSGVSVALPKAKNPEKDENIVKDTSAVVAVPDENEIWLGKEKLPGDTKTLTPVLKSKLDKLFGTRPDRTVYLKAGQVVSYGRVVDVIQAIRDAGYDIIGLVSEREKAGSGGQ